MKPKLKSSTGAWEPIVGNIENVEVWWTITIVAATSRRTSKLFEYRVGTTPVTARQHTAFTRARRTATCYKRLSVRGRQLLGFVGRVVRSVEIHRASSVDWRQAGSFKLGGREYPFFCHRHNCGWPPRRPTERTVELGLADVWLAGARAPTCEVGAVTPYYWPGRIANVIDPSDPHPLVTQRTSLFDVDLRGSAVLSISTVEHIGHGDYGLPKEPELAHAAIRKIVGEAATFLVTFPIGYNPELDDFVRSKDLSNLGVTPRHLVRPDGDWSWREERDPVRSRLPYGPMWANGITILMRDPA
jgi:hypothetical protein